MGYSESIRLAAHGNSTPITSSNIYFLDNRFHPLATSQKVCDAWQKQSEAKDKWLSAKRWSTLGSERASARKTWRPYSDITNRSWLGSKAANVGSTSSNSSLCRAPLALTRSRFWRSLKPPRNSTTGFEPKCSSEITKSHSSQSDHRFHDEAQKVRINEIRCAVVVNAPQPYAANCRATVQKVSN